MASGCELKRLTKKLREDCSSDVSKNMMLASGKMKKKKKTMFSLQELLTRDIEAVFGNKAEPS